MRALAVVLALPLALVGWQWWNDHATERLLSPIASEVSGRDVEVDCQSLWANLLDPLPRHGEVRFDVNGVPEPRIFLTHQTCDRLQAYAGRSRHGQLDCLRTLDWSQAAPLDPRSDCYERSSRTVYALLTLAHEAYHTAGETGEAATNCLAIQAMAYVGVRLGAAREEAELAARAMAALEPLQTGGYGTDRCRAGTELDLHPETRAFPTEHPIVAPRGDRGRAR
jgi:hypothetical protein